MNIYVTRMSNITSQTKASEKNHTTCYVELAELRFNSLIIITNKDYLKSAPPSATAKIPT